MFLPNSLLFMSFFRESIWYVGCFSTLYFGSYCFVTDCVVTLLLITEAGTKTNCSVLGQMINDRRCNDGQYLQYFSDDRIFFPCFQVVLFSHNNQISSWNFTTWCLLRACKFPLSRFTKHSHKNRINSFGQDWAKWLLHLRLEHLEGRENLCVHRPKSLNYLNILEWKILTDQIHCLCINVIYRLLAATNHSTNDQREQTLHLDIIKLALNPDPTVC